jgi:hypothetical protein
MICMLLTLGAGPALATVQNETLKVLASDPEPSLKYGASSAIDGTTAVIGAPRDSENGVNSGSVYVVNATTGAEVVKLLASDGAGGDFFGHSVAIDGNTVVVGAYYKSDNGTKSGAAYLFNATTGAQIAKLAPTDNLANDQFGSDVAISGDVAVVTAKADDEPNSPLGMDAGSAYLFDATTGVQLAKIFPSDSNWFDYFGAAVAMDGDLALISATGATTSTAGAVYVFDISNPAAPVQLTKLEPDDAGAGDNFGYAVAMDEGTAVISSFTDNDNGWNSGAAYLFDLTSYAQLDKLLPSDGTVEDYFGNAVGIAGTTVLVSAFQNDDYGIASGSAYFFDADTGLEITKLLPSDGEPGDQFGFSAAITDGIALVPSPFEGDNVSSPGSAYFFATPAVPTPVPFMGSTWMRLCFAALLGSALFLRLRKEQ